MFSVVMTRLVRPIRWLILAGGLLMTQDMRAQSAWADTIRYSLNQRPRFFLNIVNYNSFVNDKFVNFFGFRTGLKYNKRIKFGLGFFSLNSNVTSKISVREDSIVNNTTGELKASFMTISTEYIFFNRYPWQFSFFPIDVGIGGAYYRYISALGNRPRLETPDVGLLFYQPSVTAQYSVFKWFGVAVAGGYRFTLRSSQDVREDFNAPGFSIGVKVFVDEAYKAVFPEGIPWKGRHVLAPSTSETE